MIQPSGIALSPDGAVVIPDRAAHRVYSLDPATGKLTTIAGTGEAGYAGDGGPATEARLRNPEWAGFDSRGNLILADRGNHVVRRIDAVSGVIETVAGTGESGHAGDGGPATDARITNPYGLAIDDEDNLYIFDTDAHCVRRVDARTGVITTVVGTTERGFGGDGGPGSEALLDRPHVGVFDRQGRLVIGDSYNLRIRRWDPGTRRIETIAGNGEEGAPIEGATATESPLFYFGAIVEEPDGSLLFTSLDHRIWRIDASSGRLQVVAGTGEAGFSGDGGPATEAALALPYGLARTPEGDLIFADAGNRRIRHVNGETGRIRTLAGTGEPGGG